MGTTPRRTATLLGRPLGAALAFALLSMASDARAQDEVTSSPRLSPGARSKTAEQLHRAALVAFARGRFQTAIARWTDANELRASAAIAFNIARSYEKLDDEANAVTWYRSYLAAVERPHDQSRVARRVEQLEQELSLSARQQVTIRSIPSGASIRIDDGELATTPWTGSLAPGPHVVATDLVGYYDLSQHFNLPRDQPLALDLVLTRSRTQERKRALATTQAARTVPTPVGLTPLTPIAAPEPPVTSRRLRVDGDDPAATATQGGTLSLLGIITLAAGTAALAGALALETMRSRAEDDAMKQQTQIGFAASVKTMRSRQTLARIFGIGGAALIAGGGVMLLWPASTEERPPSTRLALLCPLSGCGAAVTGRF